MKNLILISALLGTVGIWAQQTPSGETPFNTTPEFNSMVESISASRHFHRKFKKIKTLDKMNKFLLNHDFIPIQENTFLDVYDDFEYYSYYNKVENEKLVIAVCNKDYGQFISLGLEIMDHFWVDRDVLVYQSTHHMYLLPEYENDMVSYVTKNNIRE